MCRVSYWPWVIDSSWVFGRAKNASLMCCSTTLPKAASRLAVSFWQPGPTQPSTSTVTAWPSGPTVTVIRLFMEFSSKRKKWLLFPGRLHWFTLGLRALQHQLDDAIGLGHPGSGPTLKQQFLHRRFLLGHLQGVFLGESVQ